MPTPADDPSSRTGTTAAAAAASVGARFVREVVPKPRTVSSSSSGVVPVRVAVPGVAVVAAVADAANQLPSNPSGGGDEAPAEVVLVPRLELDTPSGSRAVPAEVEVARQEERKLRQGVDVGLWRPPTW